jgi:hypothetical protein
VKETTFLLKKTRKESKGEKEKIDVCKEKY